MSWRTFALSAMSYCASTDSMSRRTSRGERLELGVVADDVLELAVDLVGERGRSAAFSMRCFLSCAVALAANISERTAMAIRACTEILRIGLGGGARAGAGGPKKGAV